MRRLVLPIALAATVATLAGCGNKGPLFLPPPPAAGTTATPQAATPAQGDTSLAPPPVSTSSQPYNSVLQQ
ncbi:LPS translocon maturation chaperone LptM [Luteibacter sp.]|jgi:predicted small lipoprotein YifL|uniref:LPS translocon maturation chaperone LptM n=1 Tax=Luteibacter sp. TaxID=1886636 RepID=UPI002F41BFEA